MEPINAYIQIYLPFNDPPPQARPYSHASTYTPSWGRGGTGVATAPRAGLLTPPPKAAVRDALADGLAPGPPPQPPRARTFRTNCGLPEAFRIRQPTNQPYDPCTRPLPSSPWW